MAVIFGSRWHVYKFLCIIFAYMQAKTRFYMSSNITKTYLEMAAQIGLSEREAITLICEAIGLKFSSSYPTQWKNGARPTPPKAVCEMQQRTASYAARLAGISTTNDKAKKMAQLLSPPLKDACI